MFARGYAAAAVAYLALTCVNVQAFTNNGESLFLLSRYRLCLIFEGRRLHDHNEVQFPFPMLSTTGPMIYGFGC